jgi:hypothetical protein
MNTFGELSSLSKLLQPPKPTKSFTPGSIGPPKVLQKQLKPSEDIWDEDQIEETLEYSDPRPQPEYSIFYSQNVSSEDIYLGMNGKTPSISHSDSISVNVKLPLTQLKEIEIHCRKLQVEIACPQ